MPVSSRPHVSSRHPTHGTQLSFGPPEVLSCRAADSPSPRPSPIGRGGIIANLAGESEIIETRERSPRGLPLPTGEGRGEGDRGSLKSAGLGRSNLALSLDIADNLWKMS